MIDTTELWSTEELRRKYGGSYLASTKSTLDKSKVPEKFWPLLGYAEFWGISDDGSREILVTQAPPDVQHNLKEVVAAFDDLLDEWLAGPESDEPNPSKEYVAYSAMRMAAYYV